MKVVTTNLAIRFYKRDGWTEPDLLSLVEDSVLDQSFKFFDDGDMAYWVPYAGVKMDIEKMLKQHNPVVIRTFNDFPNQSDLEHLESKNW